MTGNNSGVKKLKLRLPGSTKLKTNVIIKSFLIQLNFQSFCGNTLPKLEDFDKAKGELLNCSVLKQTSG